MRAATMNTLARLERLFLFLSLSLFFIFIAAEVYRIVFSRAELSRFREEVDASSKPGAATALQSQSEMNDFRLWSKRAVNAYRMSLEREAPAPLGVLKISALDLEVPVLEGTDDYTLDRAVGHIDGTPEPGQAGNIGIAGHRDGFFRPLKDLRVGDDVELLTRNTDIRYTVDELLIVFPQDVSVLRNRPKFSLTLVTCYPFYFVGSAPKRFIVHASMRSVANPGKGSQSSPGTADSENR
jgi:sortase A